MYETDAKVGPRGVLTLEHLPFADGQLVHVRIQQGADEIGTRVLGLHMGSVWMSDDFDEPLPESFWLKQDASDEASA